MIRGFLQPKYVVGTMALVFVCYLALRIPGYYAWRNAPLETQDSENVPRWMEASGCAAANDEELRRNALVLEVFRTFRDKYPDARAGGLAYAAFGHFGHSGYRVETNPSGIRRICPDAAMALEIAETTSERDYWKVGSFPGNRDEMHLRTARNAGPHPQAAIALVAEMAFGERPISDGDERRPKDLRPLARVVLAEFREAAMPWSDKAFAAMGSDDEMGTTAAQIAVATRHPGALEKTAALMDAILRKNSTDPLPNWAWLRLYQLAYAMAAAGPDAGPFAEPIVRLTCRTVATWAPPFGFIDLRPKEMDKVLAIIGLQPCVGKK